MQQSRLSFRTFETKESLTDGFSLVGTESLTCSVPTLDLSKALTPKRNRKKRALEELDLSDDSYDAECGNPLKKKRLNNSKVYAIMGQVINDNRVIIGPKQKRGNDKGI